MLHLKPEHVSLYALGLEEGTAMKAWVETGRLPAPDDDLAADMYELASEILPQHGYEQYEISNWAQPGRECRHNLQYWLNLPYVGLGPGAHGYANGVRYSVILSPQRYIRLMEEWKKVWESMNFRFPQPPIMQKPFSVMGRLPRR
jgi:oxygen-independent coproporphyrinogen-3 oxidase